MGPSTTDQILWLVREREQLESRVVHAMREDGVNALYNLERTAHRIKEVSYEIARLNGWTVAAGHPTEER